MRKKNDADFSNLNASETSLRVPASQTTEDFWGVDDDLNDASVEESGDAYELLADVSLAFEQNWTPAREFSIEKALQAAPEELRAELFERLLEIDATLSAQKSVLPSEQEYRERFPRWERTVERVYAATLADPSVAAALRVGRRVGPYKIEEIVGVGGMGVVYKARDERFGRVVALKFLATRRGDRREERVERFKREIWLMGQTPPGSAFAQAYDCASDDEGDYYVAMEYVDGVNLAKYYRERNAAGRRASGPLFWLDAVKLTREVACGLAEIHELGFVHRDVKPENVMIDVAGRTRILDLGLALWTEKREDASVGKEEKKASGREKIDDAVVVGTPAYIAPEAFREPEKVDCRSDLYGLGGVFLFLLTGARPIDWFDPATTEAPEPLETFLHRADVALPTEVKAVLTRLLEPDSERRYQRAVDAIDDLNATIEKYSPERRRACRRKKWSRICGAFVVLLGVLFYSAESSDWRVLNETKRLAIAGKEDRALAAAVNARPERLPTEKMQVEFYGLRASLYEKLAKDDEYLRKAAQDYEAVLRLDERNVEALARSAELYAKLRDFERARANVCRALKLAPFEPKLRVLDGEISVLRGEYESANEQFDDAVDALTEMLAFGETLTKNGFDVWNAALKSETLYWRARAYYRHRLGHNEFAWDDLNKALELRSDYVDALELRGEIIARIARKQGDDRAVVAAADFRRAAELSVDVSKKENLLIKAARCCERAERWATCLEVCEETLAANSSSTRGRLRRGKARFFLALEKKEDTDWNAVAADLDAGLPNALSEGTETDEFLAEIWAIRAWCGWREAQRTPDAEKKRAIQASVLKAIDEAVKADEETWAYKFGENAFNLDDVGARVATDLDDLEKARFYAQRQYERSLSNGTKKRRNVLE